MASKDIHVPDLGSFKDVAVIELLVKPGEEASLVLRLDGPWIVDVERVLEKAVRERAFVSGE